MAIPTLKQQIHFVDTILLIRAQEVIQGKRNYVVEDVLKSRYKTSSVGEIVRADFSIFELLGYRVEDNQLVIVFLATKKNAVDHDCIDFLPVKDHLVQYGKDDPYVYQAVTLEQLKEMIKIDQ
jgi:hypothetical protein